MLAIPLVLLLATLVHGAPVAVSDRRCVGGADACSRSINCYATGLCGPAFAKKSSLAIPHLKYARQDDDFDFGDSEGDDDSSVESDGGDSDSFGDNSDSDSSDSFEGSSDDSSLDPDDTLDTGDSSLDPNDTLDTGESSLDGSSDDTSSDSDFGLGDTDFSEGGDADVTEDGTDSVDDTGDVGSDEGEDDGSLDSGLGDEGSAPVTDTDGDQPPIDDDGSLDGTEEGTQTTDDGTQTTDDGTQNTDGDIDSTTEATPDAASTAEDPTITDPASSDSEEDESTSSDVDADSTSASIASTSDAPAPAQTTAAAPQTTAAAAAPTTAADSSAGDSLTCGGPSPNDATINLIKQFEGFVPSPAPDPIGLATVGFGHKCTSKSCAIAGFTFPLSQTTASQLLNNDLQQFVSCVNSAVSNSVTLTDNQLGALTSFAFNLGCGTLKSSTLLKRLNAGEDPNTVAAAEIPRFNKAGGKVLAGLVKRRAAEVALFQTASQVKAHPC